MDDFHSYNNVCYCHGFVLDSALFSEDLLVDHEPFLSIMGNYKWLLAMIAIQLCSVNCRRVCPLMHLTAP